MTQTNDDWSTAPKDGSVINIEFRGGTRAKAKWNAQTARWEVLRHSGKWVNIKFEHGTDHPLVWWAATDTDR
jgi:hypothetical protein